MATTPKTTNLPTPPDLRGAVQTLATKRGMSFKSMMLTLVRLGLTIEDKRK